MQFSSVVILMIRLCELVAKREYRPFGISSHVMHLGSDREHTTIHLNAVVSFEFASLIAIDSSCGRKQEKCPAYCADSKFTALYCNYRCYSMAPQMDSFICNQNGKEFRYSGSDSNTTKPLTKWEWQVAGWRRMYGREYLEQVRMLAFPVWRDVFMEIRIVSAASFDRRALGNTYHAVFGLAPGDGNPLYQITKALNSKPIATISANYWSYRLNSRYNPDLRLTTVGQLDSARCADWKFVKSLSSDRWVFPIEAVDYMGVKFGKALAFVSLSSQTAAKLVAAGIAEFGGQTQLYQDYYYALVPCDMNRHTMPPASFRIADFVLRLNESATYRGVYYRGGQWRCLHNFYVDHKSPHQNADVWIFGRDFFREYCVAFDYEKLTIGFARMRKWPFPYLPGNFTGY